MYTFIICELLSSFYFKGPYMQHSTHSVITDGYHLRLISWSLVHRSIYLCSFIVFVNCDLTRYVISYNTNVIGHESHHYLCECHLPLIISTIYQSVAFSIKQIIFSRFTWLVNHGQLHTICQNSQ